MSSRQTLGVSVLGVSLLATSCMLGGESRLAQGQLYATGDPNYDGFFRDVHQQQVDEASWGDDKKGAHKSLVASLDLTPDAPEVTIIQVTHESSSKVARQPGSVRLEIDGTTAHVTASGVTGDGGALFHAIEDTAHLELERAKRLRGVEPKLDALTKQGAELETHVKADFGKFGGGKGNDVANELTSAHEILTKLKARAESEARESEDFVADLGRALMTASEAKTAHAERKKKKRDRDEPATAANAKPAAPATDAPAAAPKAPPPPKPVEKPAEKPAAETGEVFTP
jgi:hypothetical protein